MLDAGPQVDFQQDRGHEGRSTTCRIAASANPAACRTSSRPTSSTPTSGWTRQQVPYTHDPKEPYNWVRVRMIGGKSQLLGAHVVPPERLRIQRQGLRRLRRQLADQPCRPRSVLLDASSRSSASPAAKKAWRSCPTAISSKTSRPTADGVESSADAGKPLGMTITKIRRALGNGQLASSFNLLLPDAMATGNLTIVPNAVVREITVDKNTGLVNGAHFPRPAFRPRTARQGASRSIVGASCLESTRILLNSEDREFQRRARPLSARPVLHQQQRRRASSPKRRTARRARARRRQRLHPALPQYQERKRRTSSADTPSTSPPAARPTRSTSRRGAKSCKRSSTASAAPASPPR